MYLRLYVLEEKTYAFYTCGGRKVDVEEGKAEGGGSKPDRIDAGLVFFCL